MDQSTLLLRLQQRNVKILAELVKVSRQTIISIETSRYIPSVLLSLKLANVLGKNVEDLFELENSD